MTTLSPENSLSARQSASFILGLHPFVRTEAWKFLTGYFSWQSSQDERLTVDSMRRKNYKALCQMYEKIQPLLENLHRNFTETRNNIARDIQKIYDKDPLGNVLIDKKRLEKILLLSYVCNTQAEYQQGFHEMMMLFQLMVEHDHETFWLFQFFLQKTEHSCVINIGVAKNLDMLSTLITFLDPVFAEHLKGKGAGAVQSLFPWFCFCFQRAFKSFDDVWRLWEVLLTGKPCRNFQVLVAYSMLQMVREQVLQESMGGDDILLACNNLIDLDADELISAACVVYAELIQKDPMAGAFNFRDTDCATFSTTDPCMLLLMVFSLFAHVAPSSLSRLYYLRAGPSSPIPCVHPSGSGHPEAQENVAA
ncbi:TBC1 domain family member 21 isoform X2 [Homo sapiens]|uniref:TBC1 domain family member 21 isoform X2 n=1 Tax=Homo sapiens TaxID=9606 RepID=UPI0003EB018E|nr:TBC1 domain family member 21 isoform X2 [Homo sapiens]|eukprot:XP_006720473.1 TBC1 domain family member 21 isoform X2 [Homo sapiens]